MSTAFFDLDRTLIDCNSGGLWVRAEWRAGRMPLRDVAWASYWLLRYALGSDALDPVYDAAVTSLSGQSEAEMDARTQRWFQAEVAHRARPGALRALAAHRAAGDRLVLATSSSIYAAAGALDTWQLDDAIATRFEVVDGHFTGGIHTRTFGQHKATAVRAWAAAEGVDLADACFYTDSITDLALLEAVGQPRVVHPDRRLRALAQARGWELLDWGRATLRGGAGRQVGG